MASVRLTKELKATILTAVRDDFVAVGESYQFSDEIKQKVDDFARNRLREAVEERDSTANAVIAVAEKEVRSRGGVLTDSMANDIKKSLCESVGAWSSFYVKAVDPESDSDELINIYEARTPYSGVKHEDRAILEWSEVHTKDYTTDQALVDEILPDFLQLRALKQAQHYAEEYAQNMLRGCNTLAQLVRKWPDAVRFVPEDKVMAMRDKTAHKVTSEPEPVAIMNMDEALRSIRLQAEAVKALKE